MASGIDGRRRVGFFAGSRFPRTTQRAITALLIASLAGFGSAPHAHGAGAAGRTPPDDATVEAASADADAVERLTDEEKEKTKDAALAPDATDTARDRAAAHGKARAADSAADTASDEPSTEVDPQLAVLPVEGADKTGASSQVISVPKGTGTIEGMGESFSAQLSTGVATFSVPFVLPAARGAAQPSLSLNYSSATGWGIAGMGWDAGVPFIARQTDRGIPRYVDSAGFDHGQDRFVFNGGQELVPICTVGAALECTPKLPGEEMPPWSAGSQYFRPRVEGSFLRFFWWANHRTWRVQDKSGVTMEFGVPLDGSNDESALETNPDARREIYRWNLTRQYDVQGAANPSSPAALPQPVNVVLYRYLKDGEASYLSDIYDTTPTAAPLTLELNRFAHHTRLVYEPRTDPVTSYKSGWKIERKLRLKRVDVTSKTFNFGDSRNRQLVRRYHLSYVPGKHTSLLESVQVEGRCSTAGEGSTAAAPLETAIGALLESTGCGRLPAMTFAYTQVTPFTRSGAPGTSLPGYEGFDERVRELVSSPDRSVDEAVTDLFDVNSDGLPDVLATDPGRYGGAHGVFYNAPAGTADSFGLAQPMPVQGVLGATAGTIRLDNANVSPLDVDGDGTVDLLHMPMVKTYSVYTPSGGSWVGRTVTTADGLSPKVDLGRDAAFTRMIDVNFDGLVDVVRVTGTEVQTFFALGRLPGGNGRFGTGERTGVDTARLSTEPVRSCLPRSTSAISFNDTETQLGDMNGDGIQDIIRLQRGAIRYWPGRGNGHWGTGPRGNCASRRDVLMNGSPQFSDISGQSLRLDDVNGDGLDDLVQIRTNAIDVWLNVDGAGFTAAHTIAGTPTTPSFVNRVRLVDVNGSGTRDILWANAGRYQYIDLQGGTRPWLLNRIENGLGKSTDIEYGTSTEEMLAAERTGVSCDASGSAWSQKWCTRMPIVTHVVKRVTDCDNLIVAGKGPGKYITEYSYRDAVYDGRQREFRGFRHARARRLGDVNSPTDVTETRFLLGECRDLTPTNEVRDCGEPWMENPREALKGLPVVTEQRDEAGNYLSTEAVTYRLRRVFVGLDGRDVRHAFESARSKRLYDQATGPHSSTSTIQTPLVFTEFDRRWNFNPASPTFQPGVDVDINESFLVPVRQSVGSAVVGSRTYVDAFGNRVGAQSTGCAGGGCATGSAIDANETISTYTYPVRPPSDETQWLFRTGRSYVTGSVRTQVRNDTTTNYNSKGDSTTVTAQLAGTVALDRRHKVAGSAAGPAPSGSSADGVVTLISERLYDQFGNLTREQGANGRCRDIGYDNLQSAQNQPLGYSQLPTSETIYTSGGCTGSALVTGAAYDRGLSKLTTVIDPTAQTTGIFYDAYGRLWILRRPRPDGQPFDSGTTANSLEIAYALPTGTQRYSYIRTEAQDAPSVATNVVHQTWTFIDGMGRTRLVRSEADMANGDGGARIWSDLVIYDAKGATAEKFLPYFNGSSATGAPPAGRPATTISRSAKIKYDAFGRDIETRDVDSTTPYDSPQPDGTVTLRTSYHAVSTDTWDAADLEPNGTHEGTFASVHEDGHGRPIVTTERIRVANVLEQREVRTQYLTTGEPDTITRVRVGKPDAPLVRWMRYDTLGRLVLNADPHTSVNFTSEVDLRAWRYVYNDAGNLLGTSDARGCGVNFTYDGAGRLIAEDYAPCEAHHPAYSAPNLGAFTGIEVFYQYDEIPSTFASTVGPTGARQPPSYNPQYLKGRLAAVYDRASLNYVMYDARGRIVRSARSVASPDPATTSVSTRYQLPWFSKTVAYDSADRVVEESTGAESPELKVGTDSKILNTYSARGTLLSVGSSYGNLVTRITRDADGTTLDIDYADAAATTSVNVYDSRRRLQESRVERSLPPIWTATPAAYQPAPAPAPAAPTSFQTVLSYETYLYDPASNPIQIADLRTAAEWPAGAKPVTRNIQYDDLYRVARVDYVHTNGADTFVSPYQSELSGATDPHRTNNVPPQLVLPERVKWQTFAYDWLGNITESADDRNALWDRGMGPMRTQTASGKPYRFQDAGDLAVPTWPGTGSAEAFSYDEAGNTTELRVNRTGSCTNGTTACNSRYLYYFDELGRLQEARRHDGTPLVAQLAFVYDSNDDRVLKSDVLPSGVANDLHTLYVFDTLDVRRTSHSTSTSTYARTADTEVPFLVANGVRVGRVVYEGAADGEPRFVSTDRRHVFLNLGDHLGSTNVVIDRATSELVERMTYQPYGAAESDYRPARWKGFREDYRFTGKEDDIEVGVAYFGRRFLCAPLGRWLTPDPLAVHVPGQADLNLYAYVHGRVLSATDPLGLQDKNSGTGTQGNEPEPPKAVDPRTAAVAAANERGQARGREYGQLAGDAAMVMFYVTGGTGADLTERGYNPLDAIRNRLETFLSEQPSYGNDAELQSAFDTGFTESAGRSFVESTGVLLAQLEEAYAAMGLFAGAGSRVASAAPRKPPPEILYRSVSADDYAELLRTGIMPGTSETFTSPSLSYVVNKYRGVVLEFELQPGTIARLREIGVRPKGQMSRDLEGLPEMTSRWGTDHAQFKLEKGYLNIGLGTGRALQTFNEGVTDFRALWLNK